jgi:tetratricopeptide (TPR) repeat protein
MISGKILRTVGILFLLACILQPALAATARDNATDAYNAGVLMVSQGKYQGAIDSFNYALSQNTTSINITGALLYTYQGKAFSQIQLGKYSDAVATADQGLAQFPKDSKLWNNKGYALYKQGDFLNALSAYDKAIAIDQNYTIALVNKGDTLTGLGRYGDAIASYNQALATDPGNHDATAGIALAQKGASNPLSSPVTLILAIVVILAVVGAVWYVKFRKPDEKTPGDNKTEGKKK